MESTDTIVGMGKFAVTSVGPKLTCLGIGSCIAVIISDRINNIFGMAHVMLAYRNEDFKTTNPNKYADVCIPNMINEMVASGAEKSHLKAKIAGGAHMFPSLGDDILSINIKNIEAVKTTLKKEGIQLLAEDTGGHNGRTVILDTTTREIKVLIRSLGEERILT